MIVPDVNLLVYAHNRASPWHDEAREWWESSLTRRAPVGIPWVVSIGFVRLVTLPRVTPRPLGSARALGLVATWLERSHVDVLAPGPRHLDLLASLFDAAGVAGRLTTDAHIAAITIEHGAELHSNDADFARFPGLRWRNPIDSASRSP